MASNHKLIVGDHVHWRGSFGHEPEEEVQVTGIQISYIADDKEGYDVKEIDWNSVVGRDIIVDLDNGRWAWAFQISRIKYAN